MPLCFVSGYGIVSVKGIEQDEYVCFYSGEYSEDPPSDSVDDTYTFEIRSKRKAWYGIVFVFNNTLLLLKN